MFKAISYRDGPAHTHSMCVSLRQTHTLNHKSPSLNQMSHYWACDVIMFHCRINSRNHLTQRNMTKRQSHESQFVYAKMWLSVCHLRTKNICKHMHTYISKSWINSPQADFNNSASNRGNRTGQSQDSCSQLLSSSHTVTFPAKMLHSSHIKLPNK